MGHWAAAAPAGARAGAPACSPTAPPVSAADCTGALVVGCGEAVGAGCGTRRGEGANLATGCAIAGMSRSPGDAYVSLGDGHEVPSTETPLIEQGAVILGGTQSSFGFGLNQQYFHKWVPSWV